MHPVNVRMYISLHIKLLICLQIYLTNLHAYALIMYVRLCLFLQIYLQNRPLHCLAILHLFLCCNAMADCQQSCRAGAMVSLVYICSLASHTDGHTVHACIFLYLM